MNKKTTLNNIEMANGWDAYINQMLSSYSAKKQEYLKHNVALSAAIYGHDGTLWAASKDWQALSEYEKEVEKDDGSMEKVKVNEFNCIVQLAKGVRNAGPAGALIGK